MQKTLIVCATIGFVAWLLLREQPTGSRLVDAATKNNFSGGLDKLQGNAKQAVGNITGDRSLQAEGLVDEALGAVKRGVGQTIDAAKEATSHITKS